MVISKTQKFNSNIDTKSLYVEKEDTSKHRPLTVRDRLDSSRKVAEERRAFAAKLTNKPARRH